MQTATWCSEIDSQNVQAYINVIGSERYMNHVPSLYLAALTFPDCMQLARKVVPEELHSTGLHVGHSLDLKEPLIDGMKVQTVAWTQRRTMTLGEHVSVITQSSVCSRVVAKQCVEFIFVKNTPSRRRDSSANEGKPQGMERIYTQFPPGAATRYSAISGDWQPIHLDKTAARQRGLPETIVHGLYTLAKTTADIRRAIKIPEFMAIRARFSDLVFWDDVLVSDISRAVGTGWNFVTSAPNHRRAITRGFLSTHYQNF